MILKIHSTNEHLLDLLNKNPNTDEGLYLTAMKNGVVAGMAVNANRYEVIFQDTKYSYLPEGSNQIDFQSYCNPLVVLNICNELFSPVLKARADYFAETINWLGLTKGEVDTQSCTIDIPVFYIDSSWYRRGQFLLSRYFSQVVVTGRVGHNVGLEIRGNTVFEAFNLLNLVAMFVHLTNESGIYRYIDDGYAAKYVRILTNLEKVPYFVFYLFIKRAIKSEKQFQLFKPVFEKYLATYGLHTDLTFYDTHFDRIRFITDRLNNETAVLDVGCGEFKYYKKMNRKGFQSLYFGVDTDSDVADYAAKLMVNPENANLRFYPSLEAFSYDAPVNIILTEVIEHNTPEEAGVLIRQLLQLEFKQIFITTPNREFNQYYQMDGDKMRHPDHQFEPDRAAFEMLITACLEGMTHECEYFGTGDLVNGIQPTQGVIIKNSKTHS